MPAAHLALESGANNINTRGLAVKIHCNIVKAFLPDIWHNRDKKGRLAQAFFPHQPPHEVFCINFWHVHPRRGIATPQVSVLFVGRRDAPAHLGSLSRAPALLQRLPIQGKWHLMGCAANEAVWAANAALITGFSCMPSSHAQNVLFISHLPISAANNRRKAASLAGF